MIVGKLPIRDTLGEMYQSLAETDSKESNCRCRRLYLCQQCKGNTVRKSGYSPFLCVREELQRTRQ